MIIYGVGKRGKALYEKCKKQKIRIDGFIDKRANDIDNSIFDDNIKILTINEAIANGWQEKTVIVSPVASKDILSELQNLGFQDTICLNDVMTSSPYYTPIQKEEGDFCFATPFNYYESPYADLALVRKNKDQIFNISKKMNINFDIENQMSLLNKMSEIPLLNWGKNQMDNDLRYYYEDDNSWFGLSCAVALYGMIMLNSVC